MSEYKAPLRDMHFVLHELAGLAEIARLPGCEEINAELVDQILEEGAKFASGVLSPLNKPADEEGSHWDKGKVTTPKGFKEAYKQFVEAGWNGLQAPAEFGGQGLPKIVSTPVIEMWKSANLSFSLVTMLTAGAAEALILRGTEQQRKLYLPKMIKGTWTGTMNLTEPQAGSDLALVRTKAVREGDYYRVSGQKI
ncbi:MAG TPA: acyl-CoA dehydrogenase N-terminal domain-containing protein, partial [Burkholderiales bacterium]